MHHSYIVIFKSTCELLCVNIQFLPPFCVMRLLTPVIYHQIFCYL